MRRVCWSSSRLGFLGAGLELDNFSGLIRLRVKDNDNATGRL